MTARTLDWKYADLVWQYRAPRRTRVLPGVARPADLRRLGYCVVATRGFLRVCVRRGWYWVVGVDTRDGKPPRTLAVRSRVRYHGDADTIADPE